MGRGTFTGTYAINSDCTGTAEVLIDVGGSVHVDTVVLSPTEFVSINTDAGSSIIYSGKRSVLRENTSLFVQACLGSARIKALDKVASGTSESWEVRS